MAEMDHLIEKLRRLDDGKSRPVTIIERQACGAAATALDRLNDENAKLRTALKYGRDCVMESFEHVKDNDDQVMADARLRAIDDALPVSSTEGA